MEGWKGGKKDEMNFLSLCMLLVGLTDEGLNNMGYNYKKITIKRTINKKTHVKRFISSVLTCALLLALIVPAHFNSSGSADRKGVSAASKVKTVKVTKAKKGMKVTAGNYVYKITRLSKKKSTVSVVGLNPKKQKKVKKIEIPNSIKIKSKKGKNKGTYTYKVTAIADNAFKSNKKITDVKLGKYVKTIGKNAFAYCTKLKNVVIPVNSELETIAKNSFKGCKKLKKLNLKNAKHFKMEDENGYTYEIIPLMAPFNEYFYIKTDNPDPDSFRFVDETSVYTEKPNVGSIQPTDVIYEDVKYEKKATARVKGGYIAKGSNTDGGELKLQSGKVTGTYNSYNITTGETTVKKKYEFQDTEITVYIDKVMNVIDYLITTYGDSKKSYFDNLSAIQKGFSSICLYSGTYVLGEQKKSTTTPYYGLSTSPHVDQTFYIQSPYYRSNSKSMLVSAIYPLRYDSVGFPSVMSSIAKKLNSSATVEWSSSAHYLVNVTLNGVTKSYGGQGNGGGQGINSDQIKYWYTFDGKKTDAYTKCNLADVAQMNRDYGKMTVPEEPTDLPKLTWASVRKTVGKDGAYVRLVLLTSIFGGQTIGYTYMYDNGSTSEGSQGWGSVGHFYNAWFEGRYYNKWEYYYPGAKFEETVEKESPSIIQKDVTIKLPEDDKAYYYNYKSIDKVEEYNKDTGVWKGFTTFRYDADTKTWKAGILSSIKYKDSTGYKAVDDQDFIDACTITMDEAKSMNLDANTDIAPKNYYIYDRVTEPGTYHAEE